MSRTLPTIILLSALLALAACQKEEAPPPAASPGAVSAPAGGDNTSAEPSPPTPPIREDFEGEPKLSLFPRVGDFRPEETDKEGQSYWLTFIDHLVRTSGPIQGEKGRAFAIRGIKSIDSAGFFAPLAVSPDTSYRVTFRFWSNLPKGGTAGVGILEFDEFLWVGDQFTRSLSEKHFQGAEVGVQLTGKHEGAGQTFTFHSGPKTRMVHLVFYREGTPDREPVVIDDIDITAAADRKE